MSAPYKTLMKRGADEMIVNKSRFIGHGAPVSDEEGALAFLNEVRKRHREATHNVYAYILGPNMGAMRFSDDGEPSGTAGMRCW
jgi:putative IMPACT (imprinted ancient) family translation regulator